MSLMGYAIYRDPNAIKRSAAAISWYPDDGHKFAVAYSMLDFQKIPADMCLDSYIWNVEHPSAPESVLTPASPLVSIKYNPKDPHVLVGGMYNGLVGKIWPPAFARTFERSGH